MSSVHHSVHHSTVCPFYLSALKAIEDGVSPVIIDNTNTRSWEMKPYVSVVRENNFMAAI